jgi:DNA-binding MarR family transcriptional regulator
MDINEQAVRILRLLRRREIQGAAAEIADTAITEALQVDPSTVRMAVDLLEIRRCVRVLAAPDGTYAVTLTDLGRVVAAQPTRRTSAP